MTQAKHISLRTKLLLILAIAVTFILVVHAWISYSSLSSDRIADVSGRNLSQAQTTAALVRAEIEKQSERIKIIFKGYDVNSRSFSPASKSMFETAPDWEAVQIFSLGHNGLNSQTLSSLQKNGSQSLLRRTQAEDLIQKAFSQSIAIESVSDQLATWALAMRFWDPDSQQVIVVIATLNRGHFLNLLSQRDFQKTFILDESGKIAVQSPQWDFNFEKSALEEGISRIGRQFAGVKEIALGDGTEILVSFAPVGLGDLNVAAVVPREQALLAFANFQNSSAKVLLLLAGVVMFISVLLVRHGRS